LIAGRAGTRGVAERLSGRWREYHRLGLPFADEVGRLGQVMGAVTGDLAPAMRAVVVEPPRPVGVGAAVTGAKPIGFPI